MTSRRLLTLILFVILTQVSVSRSDEETLTATFQSISNPATEDGVFLKGVKEIRKSKPSEEELKVWQEIVKSDKFSAERRRIAVIQIVDRHCRSGITLRELVDRTCSKSWIGEGQIIKHQHGLTGRYTVCRPLSGTTLVSAIIPPFNGKEVCRMCFRLEGDVPESSLEECLGEDESSIDSLPVIRLRFESTFQRDVGIYRTPRQQEADESKPRD